MPQQTIAVYPERSSQTRPDRKLQNSPQQTLYKDMTDVTINRGGDNKYEYFLAIPLSL